MNLFNFCKTKSRNFSLFSSRKKMVRQKSRKTVEDLYTSAPPTSLLTTTTRFEENFFPNSKNNKNSKTNEKTDTAIHNPGASRKKSKGRTPVEKKDEKTLINQETMLGSLTKSEGMDAKQNIAEENEKDEDTEEFFVQIKETVQRAVEKSLQDILVRSLREMNFKIDEILERVNANANALEKIQTDLNNKIVHYGEENSRHFRYLCMKSEYDKMFYQHQNVMTSMPVDARPNVMNPYPQQVEPIPQKIQPIQQLIQQQPTSIPSKPTKSSTMPIGCNCHNSGELDYAQRSKLSLSSKASDMGIKEVKDLLEQLQKFYDQHNLEKDNQKDERGKNAFNIPDQDDSADGDEDDESSDDMSSPSIEENIRIGGDT